MHLLGRTIQQYIVPILVHRTKHYLDGRCITPPSTITLMMTSTTTTTTTITTTATATTTMTTVIIITMLMWVVLLLVPLGSCIRTIQQYIVRAHSCIPHRAC